MTADESLYNWLTIKATNSWISHTADRSILKSTNVVRSRPERKAWNEREIMMFIFLVRQQNLIELKLRHFRYGTSWWLILFKIKIQPSHGIAKSEAELKRESCEGLLSLWSRILIENYLRKILTVPDQTRCGRNSLSLSAFPNSILLPPLKKGC